MPIRTNIHSHRHIAIVKRRRPKLAANWLRGLFETMQARRPCKRSSHYFRASTARTTAHEEGAAASASAAAKAEDALPGPSTGYVCLRALVQMQCACSCGFESTLPV